MAHEQSRFSVVIPCLNEEDYILRLLRSLEKQTYSLDDFEVIVADNRSLDKTSQVVWDYAFSSKMQIRMAHEHKQGVSKARNSGVRVSRGETIIFLDADNVVNETFLMDLSSYVKRSNCQAGTIRTLPDVRSYKAWFVFSVLELVKIISPLPFGKSFVSRDFFVKSMGYDETVVLGENVIFLREIKKIALAQNGKFGHLRNGVKCSIRRFVKEGYQKVLSQWLLAYLGFTDLGYKTMVDINEG